MSMYCPNCGAAVPEDSRFCTACGAAVSAPAPAPAEPQTYNYAPAAEQNWQAPPEPQTYAPAPEQNWQAPQEPQAYAPAPEQNWQAPQEPQAYAPAPEQNWQEPQNYNYAPAAGQDWQPPQEPQNYNYDAGAGQDWQPPQEPQNYNYDAGAGQDWQPPQEPQNYNYDAGAGQPQEPQNYPYDAGAGGFAAPPKKKKTGLLIGIIAGAVVLLGVGAVLLFTVFMPMIKYNNAKKLLDSGKYDEAYAIFEELDDYKDSTRMLKEVRYQEAKDTLSAGKYDEAYDAFSALGSYSNSEEMLLETRYQQGLALAEEKSYQTAYATLKAVASYKDTEEKLDDLTKTWAEAILDGEADDGSSFAYEVVLTDRRTEALYELVWDEIKENEDASFEDWTIRAIRIEIISDALPDSYQDAKHVKSIITWLSGHSVSSAADFYGSTRSAVQALWNTDWVQNLFRDGDALTGFLVGKWTTADGDTYFQMKKNTNGSHSSNYNLPWVAEPEGTRYFDIDNFVYFYENEDEERLADVFRFRLISTDRMEVYCYKDGSTYTLYR